MTNNKPVQKITCGGICVAVWSNDIPTPNGDRTVHRLTVERRYKDKDGQWKSTGSFNANDVPRLMLALGKAYEWLVFKKPDDGDEGENGLA